MSDAPTASADFVAALGALSEVPKSGKVAAGQRRYQYMLLPDLLGEVRRVFTAHRLAVIQDVETVEYGVLVTTRVWHVTGEVYKAPGLLLRCSGDPQSVGSAISYGRRYQLAALVGLAGGDDDDGQAAQLRTSSGNSKETQAAEYGQTRPVTRAPKRADDPADTPYQTPPEPVDPREMPDVGAPSTTTLATDKHRSFMFARLAEKGLKSDEQRRRWVGTFLNIDGEWHWNQLTSAQVKAVTNRLEGMPLDVGPERRRAGQ